MDNSESENGDEERSNEVSPMCRYGTACYRKNPEHFRQYRHPNRVSSAANIMMDKNVDVKIEIGHTTTLNSAANPQDNSQKFTLFVRCPGGRAIAYFVEKVVFQLPANFSHPIVEVTEPPFLVTESSSCSFVIPTDIFFKCSENPKKIRIMYDLNLTDSVAYTNIRLEKITFENPSPPFRELILKAGGMLYQAPDSTTPVGDSTVPLGQYQPGPSGTNKRKRGIFSESLSVTSDEFDVFGQLCASKMRKLDSTFPVQKIIAERLISEVLYQAQLKNLTNESSVLLTKETNDIPFAGNSNSQTVIKQEIEDIKPNISLIKKEKAEEVEISTLHIKQEKNSEDDTRGHIIFREQEIDTEDVEVLYVT